MTLVAYTGLSLPVSPAGAATPDQATSDVMAGLNATFDFLDTLGAVGALSEPVPGTALAPGSAAGLGLADLLVAARDAKLGGATFGGVETLPALVSAVDSVAPGSALPGGRTIDFTASDSVAGAVHTIIVGFTAKRSVDTGVDIASASPKFSFTAAKGIKADLVLSGSFTVVYDAGTRAFRLKKNGTTPSLSGSLATSIPDLSKVSAGIGILGVELGAGSTYALSAALSTTFDDPDSDGFLAFADGATPGELAAPGAAAGLAAVALTSASLSSALNVKARATVPASLLPLGTAAASVTVGSPNLLTTPISVVDTGGTLASVNAFLNLSPRDLAQGLAEIATTLVALQRAGGVDLPYLRGTVSDAVASTEAIAEYLKKHVTPSQDPTLPGRPDFASIQQLLEDLVGENALPSGADFTVANGAYVGSKLRFDLGITKTAGAAQDLNAVGAASSGSGPSVTFTKDTVKDTNQNFSDVDGEAASYTGRQVIVGSSSAVIASASGSTLTLDPTPIGGVAGDNAWQGGTPAAGTAYSISAGDPRTGVVELGDVLSGAGGITKANAKTAVAKVKAGYSVTLPIALDLRPGNSTTDCDPSGAVSPCPFQLKDPTTGLATIINELPLPADRILLKTGVPLLTADAAITTKVDVDATVGFVGVKISGDLALCTQGSSLDCLTPPSDPAQHLFSLGLKTLGGDGGDATLPQIGTALTTALKAGTPAALAGVLTSAVKGQAHAALKVDVPGASGFFAAPDGLATAEITLADITAPGSAVVSAASLGTLKPLDFDPANPLALFGVLLADLQAVQGLVSDLPGGSAGLDTPLPLVGRSLSDLIGSGTSGSGAKVTYGATSLTDTERTFDLSYLGRRVTVGTTSAVVVDASGSTLTLSPWNVTPAAGSPYELDSEIQGVVNLITAAQPPSLQDALALLKNGLGIDGTAGKELGFSVDTTTPAPVLKLDVDWVRAVEKRLPLSLSFDLGGTSKSLIGADATGSLTAKVGGAVKLGLQIPLTAAAAAAPLTALRVDPTSTIAASASLTGTDLRLASNIGPFQVALGNPDTGQPAGTQLEAKLGVALADTTHSAPVTLSEFAGALSLTMQSTGVSCPGAPSTDPLSVCAVLPVYVNGAPVSATDNAFVLRLPRDAASLADAVNLAGPDLAGPVKRFQYPADLAAKLAAAGLNMLTVGDGLFSYVEFLENALDVASADGKLPLIGKDLQAGSKFLEDLRTGLQTAFGGAPTNPTAGDIRTFLDTNVAPHLPGVTAPLPIAFECKVFLTTPGAPSAVPTDPEAGTTAYVYKVVATVNTAPVADSIPSAASVAVQNAAALDGAHFNDVSWPVVNHATGYRVLRKVGAAADFTKVADVAAGTLTYKDVSPAVGDAYAAGGVNPLIDPCPNDAPADSVTGFSVSVDLKKGNPTSADGCTTDCLESGLPLDLGVPGLSFKASEAADDKIKATLGWSLHLTFGLNRDDGFFVKTQDSGAPEFIVGAALDLPAAMQAQLAFFDIDIAKHAGAGTLLHGAFSIDLKDSAAAADCSAVCPPLSAPRLTLDDLKASSLGDLVVPKLTAGVNIDWDVKATVDSALPGVGARFLLTWDWDSAAPGDFSDLSKLAFEDVVIDPGQFLDANIGPIINQLISVFKPVQPIIDTILAPLPVLSDLSKLAGGDDVTIASLAATFSTLAGGPDIKPFIEVLKVIKTLSGLVGTCGGGSFCITVGNFDLRKDLAMSTTNSAATAATLVGDKTGLQVKNPFTQLSEASGDKLAGAKASAPTLPNAACANGKRGISFPALEDPTSLFGLLLNQDVEIACFDSGPLSLGFEMNLRLGPVYAPPPVYIVISGGASVSLRIAAGFDTYGIRTAVEKGKVDATILDSIYFKTTDTTGTPLPVVQFKGFLAAGASVSLVIIEVGVVGGIELTVNFTWNDPNNDGKFRFNEFLATALSNPICLFNVGGQLDLFISVFVTLGISPFSVSFDFELVRIKLLDFSLKPDCEPDPPRLGGVTGSTLYLFAGKFSSGTERGEPWGSGGTADESWIIRQQKADAETGAEQAVVVQALGITETFPDPGGTAISAVVLDGRTYDGKLKVLFNGGPDKQPFDKDTVVFGGNKDDTIRTGSGRSFVDGGPGKDNVSTTDRPDLKVAAAPASRALVAGGTGIDSLTVGNGADVVLGDSGLTYSTGAVSVKDLGNKDVSLPGAVLPTGIGTPATPSEDLTDGGNGVDDADNISAGLGGSTIWGGGGADVIGTATDSPLALVAANAPIKAQYLAQPNTIIGGGGGDRIKSGSAADQLYTGAKHDPGHDGVGQGDAATDVNTVDTGTGSDTVYGSNGHDNVTTGSLAGQSAKVYAAGADDIVTGGDGADFLYGGPGNDYVIAEQSTVDTDPAHAVPDVLGGAYVVTRVNKPSSDSTKTLAGGGGRDRIYGGNGLATIYGDREDFTCALGVDPLSDAPVEHPTVTTPADPAVDDAADLILGGNGIDTVNAGGGDDHVYGKGAADVLCGNADTDRIYAGAGADHVYGGSGGDTEYGDAGADFVFGNLGNDTLYGGGGVDVLEGNAGSDTAFGGTEADTVVGGTRKAARPDAGDTLYGDSGADVLIGDNGIPSELYDLAAADPAYGGKDLVWGGDQDDTAYGGLADDEVHGGNGADHLEGNNAVDHVYGEAGADNLIGGSSQTASGTTFPDGGDFLYGGANDDVVAGDNAVLTNAAGAGTPITKGRGLTVERTIALHDLGLAPVATKSGPDELYGGDDADVLLGQGTNDKVYGEGADDYAEGGPANDVVEGGAGEDDLVGGSHAVRSGAAATRAGELDTGDTVKGGDGQDVALGDNGQVLRGTTDKSDITQHRGAMTPRLVELYDLGDGPHEAVSGADWLLGENDADVIAGQAGDDRITGGAAQDYAEGGPGGDWIEGNDGRDDLVGGSSSLLGVDSGRSARGQLDGADVLWGGADDDLVLGDNAVVSRVAPHDELTYRIGTNPGGAITDRRAIRQLDLENTAGDTLSLSTGRWGADRMSGQGGTDVLLGQDGGDAVSGGSGDDYAEGQGGDDTIDGDALLTAPAGTWPGTPTVDYALDGGADGQDDLIGGKSEAGFRDGADTVHGNGAADFVLGDNGTAVRDVVGTTTLTDRVYTLRYPAVLPAGAAKVRTRDSSFPSSRFCDQPATSLTCERDKAYGADTLYGDAGDDIAYGQDGKDTMYGGTQDDDLYGELGNDDLFGEAGSDALLGDRGGVRDHYETAGDSRVFQFNVSQVPKTEYQGFRGASVTRETDLLHDVNGDAFVGAGTAAPMPHAGLSEGGDDKIRGGLDDDSIHAGWGDDLANGDSGGDDVFGDDGADVLWGGKGCDALTDTAAAKPYCYSGPGGAFDPSPHQANGETIAAVTDYVIGGRGGTSSSSTNPQTGVLGSDLLDWRPRGVYAAAANPRQCTLLQWPTDVAPAGKKGVSTTVDPCSWFEMTNLVDDPAPVTDPGAAGTPAAKAAYAAYLATTADNQHHQGVDWQYGGWGRDVLQGDVADNGPNEGDRLLDWNGAYNLYTHCNAAYGGFNDVRQHSPTWQDFLQQWSYSLGAGQDRRPGTLDTKTPGTSGYVELALVYPGETAQGSGSAYPATPGHFDNPNACGL